jgi:hypothetical protein
MAGVLKEPKEMPEIFLSADNDWKVFVSFELFCGYSVEYWNSQSGPLVARATVRQWFTILSFARRVSLPQRGAKSQK